MADILIYTDEKAAQDYADKIHAWLLKNRTGYNAEKWCDVITTKSDYEAKWIVKVPYDYQELNAKIAETKDKLEIPKTGVTKVDKIPDDWKTPVDIKPPSWSDKTTYKAGTELLYKELVYVVLIDHASDKAKTPDITPLWYKLKL